METIDTVIIGGGQAGLAMSRSLTDRGIDHVVLERGRIGERWRSERWDSLRMLTPNWMTRLPGRAVDASDPDGFMGRDDVISLLEDYAASFTAPVRELTSVKSVSERCGSYIVATNRTTYRASNVVIATGQCGKPTIPDFASGIGGSVVQLHSAGYRNPETLPAGGVLVVGAGASGLQIASELREAGRGVVLATGKHARAVRTYRGRDLWWWLDQIGSLDQTVDQVGDIDAARRTPSLGLTGARGGIDIDLGSLARAGVDIAGRVVDVSGPLIEFGDNLPDDAKESDDRLMRLLDRFDTWAADNGLDEHLGAPVRPLPVRIPHPLSGRHDLRDLGISSVVWATGYRESYPWLHVPVLDAGGGMIHRRGVTDAPGLYVLGLRFQWRRGSHFLDGVGRDAAFLATLIAARSERAVA